MCAVEPRPPASWEANLFGAAQLRQARGLRCRDIFRGNQSWIQRYELASILKGHNGCVNTIQWSPDQKLLVSGSDDRKANIWRFDRGCPDSTTALLSSHMTLHRHNIFDAQMTRCQQRIVSCGADGCVALTQVETSEHDRRMLYEPEMGHSLASKIAFAPRLGPDAFLVTFGDGRVRFFDLREREHRVAIDTNGLNGVGLVGIEMHPLHDALLAVGANDPFLRLYDLRKLTFDREDATWTTNLGTPVVSLHVAREVLARQRRGVVGIWTGADVGISGVAWSSDGQFLLANYRGGDVALFDMSMRPREQGAEEQHLPGGLCDAADLPEEHSKYHLPQKRVVFNCVRTYEGRVNEQTCAKEVRFLCGGAAVGTGGDCGHFFIWETASGKLLRKLPADRCVVNCVAPHPVQPLVCTSGIDSEIKVWDVGNHRVPADEPRKRAASEDGHTSSDWGRRRREGAPNATMQEAEQRLKDAEQRKQRGNALVKQARWIDAVEQYREALHELHFLPPNTSTAQEREALATSCHLNSALCFLNLEEYSAVVEECSKVLEVDSNSVKARFRRSRALGELHEFERAFEDVEAGLAAEPGNLELAALRTKLLKQQRQHQRREQKAYRRLFASTSASL